MSVNTKMANLKKLMQFFSSEEPKTIELSEEKLDNGTVLISDDFKEGMPIFIKSEDEDGENVKLPIGEYQMEDGKILIVEVEGEIASITEAKIESEESEEEVVEEEVVMEQDGDEKEVVAEEYDEDHMKAMHDRIEALEQAVAAMNSEEAVEAKEDEDEYKMSSEEVSEEPKEEVKEVAVQAAPEVVVEAEVAPIAHSPEVSDEKRARFYFPKN